MEILDPKYLRLEHFTELMFPVLIYESPSAMMVTYSASDPLILAQDE